MTIKYLDSSNIAAIDFDDLTDTLTIYFRSNFVYQYFGVPKATVDAMEKAPSVGVYFAKHIKNNYAFNKINSKLPMR